MSGGHRVLTIGAVEDRKDRQSKRGREFRGKFRGYGLLAEFDFRDIGLSFADGISHSLLREVSRSTRVAKVGSLHVT
jgi:hypothetical protein